MELSPAPAPKPRPQSDGKKPRPAKKIALEPVRVASPGNEDLTALLHKISTADAKERPVARLELWKRTLSLRALRKRWGRAAKLADGLAKWGGGSMLTFTAGLLIGGQTGMAVLGIGDLALLLFVGGTIFSTVFEAWGDSLELEEEHLNAVLQETKQ